LDARRYQNYWVAWDAPRHLWHFKAKVLQTLVANFGLKYIQAFSMPFDPFYNALLSEYLIPSSGRFWRLILRFPLISIASFLKGIVNPLNGSSVVYVFKKV
jgi:hypothetical protein